MKKTFTTYAAALMTLVGPATAHAQAIEQPDTVLTVANASCVTLTETSSGLTLNVCGTEDNPDFAATYHRDYSKSSTVKSRQVKTTSFAIYESRHTTGNCVTMFSGLHFGFCHMIDAPAGFAPEMGKSFEIGIDELIAYRHDFGRRDMLSVGLGINWRNYRMTAENIYTDTDGIISSGTWPENVEGRFSRLKTFSLSFPVTWSHEFHRHFGLKFGAIMNWNSHGSIKTCWNETDGTKARYSTDTIGQRKFTVDMLGAVYFSRYAGIYLKYSPMNFFKDGRGPKVYPLSTGLYFLF